MGLQGCGKSPESNVVRKGRACGVCGASHEWCRKHLVILVREMGYVIAKNGGIWEIEDISGCFFSFLVIQKKLQMFSTRSRWVQQKAAKVATNSGISTDYEPQLVRWLVWISSHHWEWQFQSTTRYETPLEKLRSHRGSILADPVPVSREDKLISRPESIFLNFWMQVLDRNCKDIYCQVLNQKRLL